MFNALENIIREESLKFIRTNYPSPRHLLGASIEELERIPKITPLRARLIKTALELNKELMLPEDSKPLIRSPEDVYNHCKIMGTYHEERFVGLYLTSQKKVIQTLTISKGILDQAIISPREFFLPAVKVISSSCIAIHNHPGHELGTALKPSQADLEATKRLKQAGDILGIPLIDHIIISSAGYVSLKDKGYL